MSGSYLGPEFSNDDIQEYLNSVGANFETFNENEFIEKVSLALTEGKAIGWFQGRMEFGPRALGARSIIADPRSESMQKNLNLKVKYKFFCMLSDLGSAIIDLAPNALGPNSILP
jgi:carbamoyltransferase